jgi:hypothetical protein
MTATDITTATSRSPLRNAAESFAIPLTDSPYLLSRQMLRDATDIGVQRKRDWCFPQLEFISLTNGTLKLNNTSNDRSYELTVTIEPDKLLVSCSCGIEVNTICHHAYKALERLMWSGSTLFFYDYKPGGLVEAATAYSRYFTIRDTELGLQVEAKPGLGTVYQLTDKIDMATFNQLQFLGGSSQIPLTSMKGTALVYILVDNYRDHLPPFLLPCIGYPNKAGTEIKRFDYFISGSQKRYDEFLTEEQKTLHLLCYQMWQLAESLPGTLLNQPNSCADKMNQLFQWWQQVFPLLQNQSFVYRYDLYWKKELKRNPSRQRLDRIEIRTERPVLQFLLFDRGDMYQLKLQVCVKGSIIEDPAMEHLFFIRDTDTLYLLSSLKDAAMVEWMYKHDNCITVFKEHFSPFEQDILISLQKNYFVDLINGKPLRATGNKKSKNQQLWKK